MAQPWSITNTPAANTAASASVSAPASAAATSLAIRLRALSCTVSSPDATATSALLVVRDGASGAGTIIFARYMSAVANANASIDLTGLDLRATPGNALTVEFTGGGGGTSRQTVNAQGDMIPVGLAYGANYGAG